MRNRKLKTNQENIVHTHFRYLGLKNEDDLKKTIVSTWCKPLTTATNTVSFVSRKTFPNSARCVFHLLSKC